MSRRIDIELTSRTGDGAFTWRAAGAKQPKGIVGPDLVPEGASVGDVVRAELESGLDGFEVVAVLARPDKAADAPANRIEVLGAPQRGPDVVVSYASGTKRRRDTERPDRQGGRESRRGGPERDDVRRRPSSRRALDGARSADGGEGTPTRERPGSPARGGGHRSSDAAPRGERTGAGTDRPGRRERPERRDEDRRSAAATARRERRPSVGTAHRNAMLASLGPQELPIAEQLLRGGIPAVRQAIAEQAAKRPANAATQSNSEAVLSIAEKLLARVNLASWKDRATSAQSAGKELRLRELRTVVTSSRTVSLDDEARAMSRALHELLDQRVQALRDEWVARMSGALDAGRVADAVRVATRPPEPATRLPAELAVRLSDAAGAAMSTETDSAEWMALLAAVVESPVRRTVKPRGIPESSDAKEAALRAAGSVPELAKLLGLRIPPPPPPRRPAPSGARVMAGGGGGRAGAR